MKLIYILIGLLFCSVAMGQSNCYFQANYDTDAPLGGSFALTTNQMVDLPLYLERLNLETGDITREYRVYCTFIQLTNGWTTFPGKAAGKVKATEWRDDNPLKSYGGFESKTEEFGILLATNDTRWVLCVDTNGNLFTVPYSASPPKPKPERRALAKAKEASIKAAVNGVDPNAGAPSLKALIQYIRHRDNIEKWKTP